MRVDPGSRRPRRQRQGMRTRARIIEPRCRRFGWVHHPRGAASKKYSATITIQETMAGCVNKPKEQENPTNDLPVPTKCGRRSSSIGIAIRRPATIGNWPRARRNPWRQKVKARMIRTIERPYASHDAIVAYAARPIPLHQIIEAPPTGTGSNQPQVDLAEQHSFFAAVLNREESSWRP